MDLQNFKTGLRKQLLKISNDFGRTCPKGLRKQLLKEDPEENLRAAYAGPFLEPFL